MVTFVTSLIGAAAILARVTSAVPMVYGGDSSSAPAPSATSGSGSYGNSYGSGNKSWSSSAAPPSYTMSSDSSSYGNSYGSGESSSSSSYSPSSYGSGSSNWNSGGYDSCVQQCVAQFGSPSSMYMPPSSTSNSSSSGSGQTHTVIVAPTQGVLRYVPFALNASVGDTVKFIWGANEHTVTKSSELTLCNKTSDQPFASGEQNKTFVFTQVVNDTNPTFYYCGTPTHCEKGMFGIINPPSAYMQSGSASMMLPSLASQYPSTQAAMSYTANLTASQPSAGSWGSNIDMSGMPGWSQQYAADNVLYTQAVMAMNPDMITSGGSIDLSSIGSNPIMLPTDVAAAASNNADNSTSSYGSPAPATSSSASSASSPSASPVSASSKNGAGVLSSPRVAVALVAVAAAFFAL